MAQPAPPRHRYTYAEYLAYEQDSGLKHEYDNGEILAMPGGSRRHNALASLSPSTEQEDRGNKWQHYQLIPSLKEYVLVSQSEPRVECYRRFASGAWEYSDVTTGVVQLATGATIDLATLYATLPD